MAQVFLRHAFALGHCRSGVRDYLAAHDIPFGTVAGPDAPGLDSATLRAFGDRFGAEIAAFAEAEEARRG